MNGIYPVTVGNRGRLVLPAEARRRAGIGEGVSLILLESSDGLVLLNREQLLARVRKDLAGLDLVSELLRDRRRAAEQEDTE